MSEYNDLFNFTDPQFGFDAVNSEYPALPADMDQSATWTAPLQASERLMEGDTAVLLLLDVDSEGSELLDCQFASRLNDSVPKHTCAVCQAPYQTDSALHQHAKESAHQAYKCKCGTGFNKASALKRHIETKDAKKTCSCPLCDDKFARKDKVKDHCHHYHKVTDEYLRLLLSSQGLNPRAGPASRRRRAAVTSAGASSGAHAPVHAPVHAPATAEPSVWSFQASAGQQFAGLPAGSSVPIGALAMASTFQVPNSSSYVPNGQFVSSAGGLAVDPALNEDFSGLPDDFLGDGSWANGIDGFNF